MKEKYSQLETLLNDDEKLKKSVNQLKQTEKLLQ